MSERATHQSPGDAEPGRRSGQGAETIYAQLALDARRKAAARAHPPLQRANFTVLVVDDHDDIRYAIAHSLRTAGFQTLEAANGVSALHQASLASAILLDIHLPDTDGMEVCRLLRANAATVRIPIVHISAMHTEAADFVESSRAGADAFLPMPLHVDQAVSVLEELLSRRQDQGAVRPG
jgi:DNA-binding response OmpR family regulator